MAVRSADLQTTVDVVVFRTDVNAVGVTIDRSPRVGVDPTLWVALLQNLDVRAGFNEAQIPR